MALIITLLTVTLLSILVVEFTYSVQVESHMGRNSLNGLQATYLARSGINILAGALTQDESRRVDPDQDDQETWGSFVLRGCSPLPSLNLPPQWQLCVRIADETGKINVNQTRPRRAQQPPPNNPPDQCQWEECWSYALQRLLGLDGEEEDIVEAIRDYWTDVPPAAFGEQQRVFAPDFVSVEDVAAYFPIFNDRSAFQLLREHVSALPRSQGGRVNLNTAPAEVLSAMIDDDEVVSEILSRREEQPFSSTGEALQGVTNAHVRRMFDVRSSYFRLEASAIVNGVGKTVRALVYRKPSARPRGQEAMRWEILFLDWQKEGGARLLADAPGQARGKDGDLAGGEMSGKRGP